MVTCQKIDIRGIRSKNRDQVRMGVQLDFDPRWGGGGGGAKLSVCILKGLLELTLNK